MKHWLFAMFLLQPGLLFGQQRPFITERAEPVGQGQLLFDIGVEFLQDANFAFSGLKGDLTRAGVVGLRLGVADNVEFQLIGSIQDILNVEERSPAPNTPLLNFSGNSTSDYGDFAVGTKILLREAKGAWPAFATRLIVELPNASNENGLGNDETNVVSQVLVQKNWGQFQLFTNLGLALLGDPVTPGSQDDLLSFGLAAFYQAHPKLGLVADYYGRAGPGGVGTEAQSRLRLGGQIRAAGLYWDVALFLGFRETDPSTGVMLGVSKQFTVPWH